MTWPTLPEGWGLVGCPFCGNVRMVPSDGPKDMPWCIHNNGTYVWRKQSAAGIADAKKHGRKDFIWTRMVPVKVTPLS